MRQLLPEYSELEAGGIGQKLGAMELPSALTPLL